ncbi:hypothetical protein METBISCDRAFT_16341 [Metschnikowia bicuspidata]|uniref:F-box domain-containing protein n=1 Tax=Metschnikowia bicuspidata TaxID=27322 RepID=A0A4P9ZC21_9ASCO|nr:hypothetical protein METBISCDRAFT_16341 [Metschnikowia bicuspidata]
MSTLQTLPPNMLDRILWFLPQKLLISLALTNYHFYKTCLRQLYRNIVVQTNPVLSSLPLFGTKQNADFIDLSKTTIFGFSLPSRLAAAHTKMVSAKLRTLINSIRVNQNLALYMETIQIRDALTDQIVALVEQLLELLVSVPNSISKLYIADQSLRARLNYHTLKCKFSLKSLTIDDLGQLNELGSQLPNLSELIVAETGSTQHIVPAAIPTLKKLRTLLIRDELEVYAVFSGALWELYKQSPFVLDQLRTLNVVHDHNNWTHGFPYVDFGNLMNFQISLGCNQMHSCNQECLELGLMRFAFGALKRLAIIQNTDTKYNNHTNTEKWDLIVFSFIETIVQTSPSLISLSIRHNVPPDGIIDDGLEGLYLRKVKLYTHILPGLLASIKSHLVNLVLPNFMASLACYEQAMNTLLWNGCKCEVCSTYLKRLDTYILYHRFYNREKEVFKDVQTTQLIRCMSEVLADRMEYDHNVGDLFQLFRPMQSTTWNFHNNKFTIPFRCLPAKTYEIDEMEDELQEISEGQEKYFDASESTNDCQFLYREQFYPYYTTVIAHYIDEIVRKMVNLNRGDAEDVEMARKGDIYDGYTEMLVKKMIINGMTYTFDHELNGTICFTNLYDTCQPETQVKQ